ncbi:pectinesterase family protein [Sphingomonas turrisvirgatae]|uniref:Pectinesterase catalytic domain-containing protein n=1 Tax=Sphingomonas turrisvirgatae TaxID=1888892 RepID=A0A1E3LYF9_9SPHN|nr:pectinesterase family protein [Sphingomonas turrisvirgatae]ODP38872.1 hypothetical protein BFL28_13205 [Sphingomonas turrisvirgatae]
MTRWVTAAMTMLLFVLGGPGGASAQPMPAQFPVSGAQRVNPDTQLVIEFASPPMIGSMGQVRVFDADTGALVDALDLSIPAGPDPARIRRDGGRDTTVYQRKTIGGVPGFHFHPVIVRGNRATIHLHQPLAYGRRYRVEVDPGVLTVPDGSFDGIKGSGWTFATRAAPPPAGRTRYVVASDGRGDFNTVQGALDFVPAVPRRPVTIFIRNGNYEEIVFARRKSNLILRGESRDGVVVGYGNNSAFNPPEAGVPNRRPAFSIADSTDIQLSTFTINNYYIGQAEALLITGARNILDRMTLNGSGDALQLRGPTYLTGLKLTGHGDTILSVGPAFFDQCEIRSIGPFNWVRNPATNHGHVFRQCTFIGIDEPLPWTRRPDGSGQKVRQVIARLPDNKGINYPHAEIVLINTRMDGIAPEGWGPVQEDGATFSRANVRFWEFGSTDLEGRPIDMSKRHEIVRELKLPQDAKSIADYSNPAFVLGGWSPKVR